MRIVRSLTARLVLGHIAVATLTGVTLTLALVVLFAVTGQRRGAEEFVWDARATVLPWLFGDLEARGASPAPPGYVLVVAPDGRVAYAAGDTPCARDAALAACAPNLQTVREGRRFVDEGGRRWVEIVETTITGERVINRRRVG